MAGTLWDFLGLTAIRDMLDQLNRIEANQEELMATYAEAKQEWVDYTEELQSENAELRQALTDAQATAQANADALAQFQADDAQTDAQALADQEQAFADDLQSTLDGLKEPAAQPDPLPENPDDQPHPDNTLPGDLEPHPEQQ